MGQEDTPAATATATATATAPSVAASTAAAADPTKIAHLVLDTGALIKGQGYRLAGMAARFWTIPEVIAEVRDPKSRFHLATLPFELHTKEPTPESVKAVAEFARRTGDYPSLSKVDMRVLALAYTLEAQHHGGSVAHLRTAPAAPLTVKPPPRPAEVGGEGEGGEGEEEDGSGSSEEEEEEESDSGSDDGSGSDSEEEEDEEEVAAAAVVPKPAPPAGLKAGFSWAQAVKTAAPPAPAKAAAKEAKKAAAAAEAAAAAPAIPLEQPMAALDLGKSTPGEAAASAPPPATPRKEPGEVTSRLLGAGARTAATEGGLGGARMAEEDDGQGWIGVENLQEARARGSEAMFMGARAGGVSGGSSGAGAGAGMATAAAPPPGVACVTADFGMQNVLLQMGLHLLSVDGVAVTRVKQWVRRCDACAKLVHNPDRMFCPRCGNGYLSRASVSVDRETGQLKVHLSKLWRPRKGCKYSIPKPDKHGRFEGDLLLREDQLMMGIWRQRVKRRARAVDSMFGSEVTESLGLAVGRTAAQEGIQYGYGRKNPNAQKGRERRGKKKRSKGK